MIVVDLKAFARERGLRGYSRLGKAELIALLQNDLQPPRTRPPKPTRPPPSPHLHRKHNRLGLDQIDRDDLNL